MLKKLLNIFGLEIIPTKTYKKFEALKKAIKGSQYEIDVLQKADAIYKRA